MFTQLNPVVITVHAVAHVLELGLHAGLDHHPEITETLQCNQDLYSEYSRSGRAAGWTDIAKIPVDTIIERWMAKGCEKGQSRRLQKLFADGHVVDAEMEQAAGVTVSDVRVAT